MRRILSIATITLTIGYIIRLRHALSDAVSRGDMYRDIAASLEQQRSAEKPS